MKTKSRRRVIDQLRKMFPDDWLWDADLCEWRSSKGMIVRGYSVFCPSWPDDDSTFRTAYCDQDGNEIMLDQSFRTYRVS